MVQKTVRVVVAGRIRVADGRISFMCACCVSVVSALDAAISEVRFDAANHYLVREHSPDLLRLASARARAAVYRSGLAYAAGVRIGGHRCWHSLVAPYEGTCAR